MIPCITDSGRSFAGAAAYYLHDKGASTQNRIAWTHVENLPTRKADKAVKVMAFTALHQATIKRKAGMTTTGRKLEKPVFVFSISWHPDENPKKDHMLETAKSAVSKLGLSEYQAIYVAHNDEPQPHVHVMINRVHPENGIAATLSNSKRKLSKWAHDYEKEQKTLHCWRRWRRHELKMWGGRNKKNYGDPVIQQAWERSDNGRSFIAALNEQGYHLAQGRKRLVITDKWGKSHNPLRHLHGVKAREFKTRVADIENCILQEASQVQREIKSRQCREYHARWRYNCWNYQQIEFN